MLDVFDHRHRLRNADHTGVTKEEALGLEGLEVHGKEADLAYWHDATERPPDLHRFDGLPEAASEIVKNGLQRCSHRYFKDAGLAEGAVEGKQFWTGALSRADGGVTFSAER